MPYIFVFCLILLCSCGSKERQVSIAGATMGTSYSIKCVVGEEIREQNLQKAIDKLLVQFDADLSSWNPHSWISKFNNSSSTEWQSAPPSVLNIVEKSIDLFKRSRGAFDITLSPLIERWGFGAGERTSIPTDQELGVLLAQCGSQHLEVDVVQQKIRKKIPQLSINASAIAKGYGVDLVSQVLIQKGISQFMVEIGGEVRCQGHPLDKEAWHIGIQQPDPALTNHMIGIVPLKNFALATSGDYRNFFKVENQIYNHILDPMSGRPVQHSLCSATVLAPNCALADGLATTCLVLGTQLSLQWIKQFPNCSVLLVERQKDGSTKIFQSANFPLKASDTSKY